MTILERTTKLALIEPEPESPYTQAWTLYNTSPSSPLVHPDHLANGTSSFLLSPQATMRVKPPGYLDQPRYRCPKAFAEVQFALDRLLNSCGVDGVDPIERMRAMPNGSANGSGNRDESGRVDGVGTVPEASGGPASTSIPPPIIVFVSIITRLGGEYPHCADQAAAYRL